MLIFVSMAYVMTSIPYRLVSLVLLVPQVANTFDLDNTCDFIIYNLIVISFHGLWAWNYAINFYMYCAGGGKRYRSDIKEVLSSWLHCCEQKGL
jgi:hypothetical protein